MEADFGSLNLIPRHKVKNNENCHPKTLKLLFSVKFLFLFFFSSLLAIVYFLFSQDNELSLQYKCPWPLYISFF